VDLVPGAAIEHLERWSLYRNIRLASLGEDEIERVIQPLL
jgi:hypothetical protein